MAPPKTRETVSYPRFFNPEELGKSLKEVATDLIYTTHHDVISRWLHSAQDADLFIWMDADRRVIKQQISFFGQVVEWNAVEGVRTGLIIESEDNEGAQMNASEVVRFDPKPQAGPIEQAVALLGCIAALKDEEKVILVGNFRMIASSTTMPADMFAERFGAYLNKPVARVARVEGWLARLRRFFK